MKEEALKLADYVDTREINNSHLKEASAMIRRLVEELDKLKDMLAKHQDIIADWDKKPLSDEEILDACISGGIYDCINDPYYDRNTNTYTLDADLVRFARAIEERHGIK